MPLEKIKYSNFYFKNSQLKAVFHFNYFLITFNRDFLKIKLSL